MKFLIYFLICSFLILPNLSLAAGTSTQCSQNGYTVVTINGILTSDDGARANRDALEYKLGKEYKGEKLKIDYFLNPSHIAGIGDLIMSVYQKFFDSETVQDYDLVEMWKAASEKIGTQKLLFVAHSQGNFYANSLYDVLADKEGGVPAQSLGVYSVATPASRVAGNGKWLTSETDHVIAGLVNFVTRSIMPPNTRIEEVAGGLDPFSGHDFSDVYLKYRTVRIVSDVQDSLDKLQANTVQDTQRPCIAMPKQNIVHTAQGAALAIADAMGNGVIASVGLMQQAGYALGDAVVAAGATTVNAVKQAGSSLLAFMHSVPVPPASSLIAGALPLTPAQTPLSQASSDVPVQQRTQTNAAPIPQVATKAVLTPSVQTQTTGGPAASSTVDVALAATTSSAEIITTAATSTSTPDIVLAMATSTPEIVVAPPIPHGGGSITGVSAEDLAKRARAAQNTAPITEQTATATAGAPATPASAVTATSSTDVVADPNPVVINEVAWMGTQADSNGEWIELYNRTGRPVDFTGWTLESANKSLSVALAGVIPAHGYFLLERTASTTTDREEDMTYAGELADAGPDASLYLKDAIGTIDSVDFGYWPAGQQSSKYTMERVSPYAEGDNPYNWRTYSESLSAPVAKDGQGNDVFGTPKAKNSVAGFYTPSPRAIGADTVWHKAYGPYYVPAPVAVMRGATLTIEPGTVVKFAKGGYPYYGGGLEVHGVLNALGTRAEPVVFTSVLDDQADGIDSNQDAASTSPSPADWMHIDFLNALEPSTIRNARIRYGGRGYTGTDASVTGVLNIQDASPVISDSLFDGNEAITISVEGASHPVISGNTIRNTVSQNGYGIRLADADSAADIVGNTFENNGTAIFSESATDAPLVVRDNVFAGNQRDGEFRGYKNFNLDNSGNRDENPQGAFFIGASVSSGQTKTLKADGIPYIGGWSFTIEEGGVLTIEPGTVMKFANTDVYSSWASFTVRGTLNARGTAEHPIVFTASTDDGNGDGSSNTSSAGSWTNIQFLGAHSSDSVLEHAVIVYGGQGRNLCPWYANVYSGCMAYEGAVLIDGASPTVSRTVFDSNQTAAIYVQGDARPVIRDSRIGNTVPGNTGLPGETAGGYGISIGPESQPMLADNAYSGNVQDVVYR